MWIEDIEKEKAGRGRRPSSIAACTLIFHSTRCAGGSNFGFDQFRACVRSIDSGNLLCLGS